MIPIPRNADPLAGPSPGPAGRAPLVEPPRLPAGTAVGSFVLQKVLARDEFSIRYLASASASAVEVTIEEFAPAGISLRDAAGTLRPRSPAYAALWDEGLQAFLHESELLARPLHPALMRIGAVWQLRGTAYRLWPQVAGRTLAQVCAAMTEPPTEAWLRRLLAPLLDALESLHEAGWVHGNVSPGQILVQTDGTPMLLDTAAVRTAIGARMPQHPAWPEADFRPPELNGPPSEQAAGPWSDLYALAAVTQACMSGPQGPLGASQAAGVPAAGRYASSFVAIFERSLAVDPRQRPQSVAAFRQQLQASTAAQAAQAPQEPQAPPERGGLALSDIPVLSAPFQDRDLSWPVPAALDLERDTDRRGPRSEPMLHGASRPRGKPPAPRRRWTWALAAVLGIVVIAAVATYQLRSHEALPLAGTAPPPSPAPADQPLVQEPSAAGPVAEAPPSDPGLAPPQPAASAAMARSPEPAAAPSLGRAVAAPPAASASPPRSASSAAAAPPSRAAAATAAPRREAVPDNPAAVCAPRTNFALYRCMQTQCERSRFYAHPQCVRLRVSDDVPS